MRPGAVGISLVGTRRPGRQQKRLAAAPVSRAQPQNPKTSIGVCALGQGRPRGDAAVSGACRLTSVPVRGPEGDVGRKPRVCAEERFRSDANGHPAVARTRGGRRQDPRPDSKTSQTNLTESTINSTVTAHVGVAGEILGEPVRSGGSRHGRQKSWLTASRQAPAARNLETARNSRYNLKRTIPVTSLSIPLARFGEISRRPGAVGPP